MTRRRPPELPKLDRPLAEMTAAERAAFLRQTIRVIRDDEVRCGSRRPRNMREVAIAREGRAEREERQAQRIARAERRSTRASGTDP